MRWIAAVCLIGMGCTAGAEMRPRGKRNSTKIAAIETRLAALEGKHPTASRPPTAQLEARVKELENRLAALTEQVEKVAAVPVPAPSPPPPTRRFGLDPSVVHAVPIDDSPVTGPADAAVTIVAAVQFPEPYTHRAWPVLKDLRKEYRKDLRIVFKSFVVHGKADKSSVSACAAARQRQLDKMEDAIYAAAQQAPAVGPPVGLRELDELELREIARALRLDLKQYDLDLPGCKAGQLRDIAMFGKLGQGAVPVFWINGRPLSGAQSIESFRVVIEQELAKAKQDRAAGGKAADYYERVTKHGLTGP